MPTFTLVLFPDELSAFRAYDVLERLHRTGTLPVRGAVLVDRDEHGLLSLRKETLAMHLGANLGSVVARAPADVLEFLVRDLDPGTFALVAELCGERTFESEARIASLGGRVVRDRGAERAARPG